MCLLYTENAWSVNTSHNVMNIVGPAEMPVDTCKTKLICCGDSLAYENLGMYTNAEFELGTQLYYHLYCACKYPQLKHSCGQAIGFITLLMYGSPRSYCYMNETCRSFFMLLLSKGIEQQDSSSALYLYDYYCFAEKDSIKAADYANLYYSLVFHDTTSVSREMRLAEWANRWSSCQRLQPEPPQPKAYPINDSSIESILRQKIRASGDIVSYKELIQISRQYPSQRVYHESLFEALMMVFRFDYKPAINDVHQILSSFYSEDECEDDFFVQIMKLFD